jgi:ectoine hydroxylase-related dioxygenase (phytanoyl-CoA dioxygenase family)
MAAAVPTVDLEELDREGVTVVRGLLPRSLTAALRRCTDALIEARRREAAASDTATDAAEPPVVQDFRNLALYGGEQVNIFAAAIAEGSCLSIARQLSKCGPNDAEELQLIEQVLIKTDPSTPEQHGPTSFHLDWIFLQEHYDAVPRETYFHMVTYLCDVEPGQAAFTIVPGSHRATFAAAGELCTHEELQRYPSDKLGQAGGPFATLKADPIGVGGIDTSDAVEITGAEGDCVICEFHPPASQTVAHALLQYNVTS